MPSLTWQSCQKIDAKKRLHPLWKYSKKMSVFLMLLIALSLSMGGLWHQLQGGSMFYTLIGLLYGLSLNFYFKKAGKSLICEFCCIAGCYSLGRLSAWHQSFIVQIIFALLEPHGYCSVSAIKQQYSIEKKSFDLILN